MFILINVNLLLAILLIYLVFRNLVKLLYDRKRKVIGAKLRTRLVVAFISLTLLPTIVLFLFSINFITTSMEFWFKVPVEQSLEKSLSVGRSIYKRIENNNQFFMERIAYQIKTKKLLIPDKDKALSNYIQVVQRAFNFDAVEVYSANSKRLMLAISPELKKNPFKEVSADDLIKKIIPKSTWSITEKINQGELVKTIGTIPFGAKPDNTLAFVVVTTMIPPDLSESMESISRGFFKSLICWYSSKPLEINSILSERSGGIRVDNTTKAGASEGFSPKGIVPIVLTSSPFSIFSVIDHALLGIIFLIRSSAETSLKGFFSNSGEIASMRRFEFAE